MPAFDSLVLETPRLRLRPLRRDDAGALYGVFSDPRVMRYWSTAPWTDLAPAHILVETDQQAMAAGEHLRLGLERRDDGALLGTCTLYHFHWSNRRADIGYALAFDAWGQGYMGEALAALVGHGFDELGLNRLEADIDPRNLASARALGRLGFREEGLLRERWIVEGEVSDSAIWGLLRSDWLKARAAPHRRAPGEPAPALRR